jgi:hypothetical protein
MAWLGSVAQRKKFGIGGTNAESELVEHARPGVQIEHDYHGWLLDQASALRAHRSISLDWENLAEELEAMAARDRREIKNHLKNLLLHLLKFHAQPAELNRHHSWRSSVWAAREAISDILEDSPGIFQGKRDDLLAQCYVRARREAIEQSRLETTAFPEVCPWSFEQIMSDDFFPGVSRAKTN